MQDKLLIAILVLPLVLVHLLLAPIVQDQAYHDFADQRSWLGVPNFLNVASSLLFFAVGFAGLMHIIRRPASGRPGWGVFFAGMMLVGPGSVIYHWHPDDASLVWDRLPMTIAFVGFLGVALSEAWGRRFEPPLLALLVTIGAYSVLHWRLFDDLRPYVAVQLTPILVLLYFAVTRRAAALRRGYLLGAFGLYALARITELRDLQVFELTAQTVSGHTLKHGLAAAAIWIILQMKRRADAAAAAR